MTSLKHFEEIISKKFRIKQTKLVETYLELIKRFFIEIEFFKSFRSAISADYSKNFKDPELVKPHI